MNMDNVGQDGKERNKFVVKNPNELQAILIDHGVDSENIDRMVQNISDDLKAEGEIFLWDGEGGFKTVTNHALEERRAKHGSLSGKPKTTSKNFWKKGRR
tara:strand:- start:608 stop:907 length:300 start_codon:yes stop_codon:yes gene_type:complete